MVLFISGNRLLSENLFLLRADDENRRTAESQSSAAEGVGAVIEGFTSRGNLDCGAAPGNVDQGMGKTEAVAGHFRADLIFRIKQGVVEKTSRSFIGGDRFPIGIVGLRFD